ncbi:hypothetical protein EYF80_039409 [Liparis tanakae]|uniref:Uncharacterized protein n=1 Tax=Liparis tanakae TaxID=230148 RepID=A0A4Z2GCE6_9TELE|nr:hypothetical protein EYF80_039409 [Liparis tanakae]
MERTGLLNHAKVRVFQPARPHLVLYFIEFVDSVAVAAAGGDFAVAAPVFPLQGLYGLRVDDTQEVVVFQGNWLFLFHVRFSRRTVQLNDVRQLAVAEVQVDSSDEEEEKNELNSSNVSSQGHLSAVNSFLFPFEKILTNVSDQRDNVLRVQLVTCFCGWTSFSVPSDFTLVWDTTAPIISHSVVTNGYQSLGISWSDPSSSLQENEWG